MTMAKVITMSIKLNNHNIMNMVATVNPKATPEMFCAVYGIDGKILFSETSQIMPLPYALAHAHNLKMNMGII